MLRDNEIQLVVVNTPNYTHFEFAKKALEAGKHVVVEKPFTVTAEEGEELIALAKNKIVYCQFIITGETTAIF
jgi:predicted dehydrogenase